MQRCANCGSDVQDIEERCTTCGDPAGFPNVRVASREKSELERRYQEAIEFAKVNGFEESLKRFDESIKNTVAVVNVSIRFLFQFITDDKALYSTYGLGVRGQIRKLAKEDDDQHRKKVEGLVFGTYGEQIRYAALSLDGSGVESYGPFAMKLRDVTITKRASLLEDNSYDFISKHAIRTGADAPQGSRATWEDRHKLATSKLASRITPKTAEAEYAKILLFSEGDYETDDFIEVHIYGPFDANAIESVKGRSRTSSKLDRALLATIKEHLLNAGKHWVEE
jgi:hypothetical protein